MRQLFLLIQFFLLATLCFGQTKLDSKAKTKCAEVTSYMHEIQSNQNTPLTIQELNKIDRLVKKCSDKTEKSSLYKTALTREFNLGSFKNLERLLQKYKSNFSPIKSFDDSVHLSSYHLFLGTNNIRLNQWNAAVKNLDYGIKIARLTNHRDNQKNGYIMLSILFGQIKDAKKSIEYAKKAIQLDKKNKPFDAYCDFLIGLGYNGLTNYDSSTYYFQESERKYIEIKDFASAVYSKTALIKAHQTKYESKPAQFQKLYTEQDLKNVLTESESTNHPFAQNEIHTVLSNYYLHLNRFDDAEKHAKKAYDLALYIENDETISQASEAILKAMLSKKNPSDRKYLEQFIISNKRLYNSENAQSTLDLREKYDVQEKENQLLEERNRNLSFKLYSQYTIAGFIILTILLIGFLRRRARRKNEQIVKLQKHAMQVQMNPHFMFNSLNSINNYITTNNIDNAQDYLTKFAKLMRVALKSSQEEAITIEDEMQFLDGYLTLEQLRNPNFEYQFDISDALKSLKIPPLLIQPLIENSVIHGFKHLPHKGKLILQISKLNDKLIVELSDNGWGMAETIEKKGDHKSFATQIQQDRLKLYSIEYGKITYSSGIEGHETPGTSVTFQLPILS